MIPSMNPLEIIQPLAVENKLQSGASKYLEDDHMRQDETKIRGGASLVRLVIPDDRLVFTLTVLW
jgi:hypothetical protein